MPEKQGGHGRGTGKAHSDVTDAKSMKSDECPLLLETESHYWASNMEVIFKSVFCGIMEQIPYWRGWKSG